MSYRDTAEDIYEEFKDEYLYGYNNSTPVMFAVETADGEDIITFKQEGKKALNSAMDTLLVQVSKTLSGVAIHHIKSWYELN